MELHTQDSKGAMGLGHRVPSPSKVPNSGTYSRKEFNSAEEAQSHMTPFLLIPLEGGPPNQFLKRPRPLTRLSTQVEIASGRLKVRYIILNRLAWKTFQTSCANTPASPQTPCQSHPIYRVSMYAQM